MNKTYADGLREAAELLEKEILPEQPENVVPLKKPSPEMAAVGVVLKAGLEGFITVKAARLRQMADEAEGK